MKTQVQFGLTEAIGGKGYASVEWSPRQEGAGMATVGGLRVIGFGGFQARDLAATEKEMLSQWKMGIQKAISNVKAMGGYTIDPPRLTEADFTWYGTRRGELAVFTFVQFAFIGREPMDDEKKEMLGAELIAPFVEKGYKRVERSKLTGKVVSRA